VRLPCINHAQIFHRDTILNVGIFGCEAAGYPVLVRGSIGQCELQAAHGWLFVPVIFFVVITGSYILPTVLIGIVAISFDEATRRAQGLQEMVEGMAVVVERGKEDMPAFFKAGRVESMREAFDEMDADGELSLDVHEVKGC
jgi:pentatricopeptide repeat protein